MVYDVIIIGAGTAGLSAAIYTLRSGKNVLIFESEYYGGQIVNTLEVENYPGLKKFPDLNLRQIYMNRHLIWGQK